MRRSYDSEHSELIEALLGEDGKAQVCAASEPHQETIPGEHSSRRKRFFPIELTGIPLLAPLGPT